MREPRPPPAPRQSGLIPAGMTATAACGPGWSCTLGTLTCIAPDALAERRVSGDHPHGERRGQRRRQPSSIPRQWRVPATPTRPTTPRRRNDHRAVAPDLAIAKTHSGNPTQGQTGFVYTITVQNVGNAPRPDNDRQDTLPTGLTATAISGSGWSCAGARCPARARRARPRRVLPGDHADGERGGKRAGHRHQHARP